MKTLFLLFILTTFASCNSTPSKKVDSASNYSDYKILRGNGIAELEQQVNLALSSGYSIAGGVGFEYERSIGFFQAVAK